MYLFYKYFFCLHFFLTINFFSTTGLASNPPLKKETILKTDQIVTAVSFKVWVEAVKNKIKQFSVKKSGVAKTTQLLKQINQQLQAMQISKAAKALLKTKVSNKQSSFLLPFQLSSFQELFPLVFLAVKTKNKKQNCVYLKQKIIYDLYPNYEDTKNLKLPYSHQELKKILQIICTS